MALSTYRQSSAGSGGGCGEGGFGGGDGDGGGWGGALGCRQIAHPAQLPNEHLVAHSAGCEAHQPSQRGGGGGGGGGRGGDGGGRDGWRGGGWRGGDGTNGDGGGGGIGFHVGGVGGSSEKRPVSTESGDDDGRLAPAASGVPEVGAGHGRDCAGSDDDDARSCCCCCCNSCCCCCCCNSCCCCCSICCSCCCALPSADASVLAATWPALTLIASLISVEETMTMMVPIKMQTNATPSMSSVQTTRNRQHGGHAGCSSSTLASSSKSSSSAGRAQCRGSGAWRFVEIRWNWMAWPDVSAKTFAWCCRRLPSRAGVTIATATAGRAGQQPAVRALRPSLPAGGLQYFTGVFYHEHRPSLDTCLPDAQQLVDDGRGGQQDGRL